MTQTCAHSKEAACEAQSTRDPRQADLGGHKLSEGAQPEGGRVYRYYVLLLLLTIYCFSYVDRQIIAVLSPQIKAELQINDAQLGALKGLAFSLFYTTMAIPLAIVSDRWNRVRLIAIALSFWSAMTATCGLAQSFAQMFAARAGVGIGEAAGNPASHALLSDYFRRNERATALGIYQLGVPIGTLISFLFGSWIAVTLGWRMAFVVVGLPGLALALLVQLTIRELPRGSADEGAAVVRQPADSWVRQTITLLKIPSFRIVAIAGGLQAFGGYAMMMWLLDLSVRMHGQSIQSAAVNAAIVLGIGGGIGTLFGGMITDRFGRRRPSNYFLVPGVSMLVSGPVLLAGLWADPGLGAPLMFISFVLIFGCMGPFYGMVQMLAPATSRALAVATFSLSLSILGSGLGPFLTGAVSDLLQPELSAAEALRWALCIVPLAASAAGVLLIIERRRIVVDLAG